MVSKDNQEFLPEELIKEFSDLNEETNKSGHLEISRLLHICEKISFVLQAISEDIITLVENNGPLNFNDHLKQLTEIIAMINYDDFDYKSNSFTRKVFKRNNFTKVSLKYEKISVELEKLLQEFTKWKVKLEIEVEKLRELLNESKAYEKLIEKLSQLCCRKGEQSQQDLVDHEGLFNIKREEAGTYEKAFQKIEILRVIVGQIKEQISIIKRNNEILIKKLTEIVFTTVPLLNDNLARLLSLQRTSLTRKSLKALEKRAIEELELKDLNSETKAAFKSAITTGIEQYVSLAHQNEQLLINQAHEIVSFFGQSNSERESAKGNLLTIYNKS